MSARAEEIARVIENTIHRLKNAHGSLWLDHTFPQECVQAILALPPEGGEAAATATYQVSAIADFLLLRDETLGPDEADENERIQSAEAILDLLNISLQSTLAARDAEIAALKADKARMGEALTPSADTKAAYSGEFKIGVTYITEDEDEVYSSILVPWDQIKEIMAAILARSALKEPS